jgi:hypothetical protein
MAEGCVEKLSMLPGFLHFIVTTSAASTAKQRAFFERTDLPKHRFTRSADFYAYVGTLL